jgi:hypothetical protein
MGIISALAGPLLALAVGISESRRLALCRIAGLMSVLIFGLTFAFVYLGVHGSVFAWLFALLSLTSSLSSIMLPLLRATNSAETADVAVSMMNFSLFLGVAVMGNLVGWLMNRFPPVPHGGLLIYGQFSYLAVFAGLGGCALLSALCTLRLKRS